MTITTDRPEPNPEPTRHRARWAAIGAALAVGVGAGAAALPVADAITSSGERAVYTSITPCRLADFRPATQVGPRSSPLGPNETHTIAARGAQGDCTAADLPADAVALQLNVTALGATPAPTFLAISPDGVSDTSSLNPVPGAPPTPNAVTVRLASDGSFKIFNRFGSVNAIVDVTGFYTDHDHDDRYYTEAEIDDRLADARSLPLATGFDIDVDGDFDMDFSLVVPEDFTGASDPRAVVLLVPGLDAVAAPCQVDLSPNYVWATRPGENGVLPGGFGSNLMINTSPADLEFEFTSSSSLQTKALEFDIDVADTVQPGDLLAFGYAELGSTTCSTGSVVAATLYYD